MADKSIMDIQEIITVIEHERECVSRQMCDRDCGVCDLVLPSETILTAYDDILSLLHREKSSGVSNYQVTNADHFRAMTDEELTDIVPCPLGFSMFRCPKEMPCFYCKREWLKQPYVGGDDNG